MKMFKILSFLLILAIISSHAFAENWQLLTETKTRNAEVYLGVDEDSIVSSGDAVTFMYRIVSSEGVTEREERMVDLRIRIDCKAQEFQIFNINDASALPVGYQFKTVYPIGAFVPPKVARHVCPKSSGKT